MIFHTEYSSDLPNDKGWVYCLASPDNEFIKVGKTNAKKLSTRLNTMKGHNIYGDMELAWVAENSDFERFCHWMLRDYCLRYFNPKRVIKQGCCKWNRRSYKLESSKTHFWRAHTIELFKASSFDAMKMIKESDPIITGKQITYILDGKRRGNFYSANWIFSPSNPLKPVQPAKELLAVNKLIADETKAMREFHGRLVNWSTLNPNTEITLAGITKNIGSRYMGRRYLRNAGIKTLIDAYNSAINN